MLSAEQMAALVAELRKPAYAALTEAQAFDWVHNGSIAEWPETRLKAFTAADLLTPLSVDSAAKLVASPSLPAIRADITAQDRDALDMWIVVLRQAGIVTDVEATTLHAVLTATETVTMQQRGHPPIAGSYFPIPMPNRIDDDDFHLAFEASRS